ncbi:MAG: CDP-alcohol phosphatidyltransferase family protein [Spirochaetes bacterium]|nr:CDP-alcohol phosphatidyltransferase family protein [Spirochaetota bacterium]
MALAEYPQERSIRFVLIALLIVVYTIGDHFDGMQAKRTGTSSALGELFDHYLDIFNNGILVYIICLSFQITNPVLIAFLLTAGYLPHAATFYEQFSTKWLYFEKIGSLESLLLFPAFIIAAAFDPVYRLALTPSFGGFTLVEIVFILLSSGTFITFAKIIRRAKITDAGFWTFCVLLTVVSCVAAISFHPTAIFYVITTYSGLYIGNLQRGHLADGKKRIPDIVVPLVMAAAMVSGPIRQPFLFFAVCIYLACHTLWIAGNAFWLLRGFWVWKNK